MESQSLDIAAEVWRKSLQIFCSHFGANVESLRLHFVLHPTTSGIRHCYFLLVCLFWLQRRWWHFVARYSPRNRFVSQWKNQPGIHIDDISSHPFVPVLQCLCQCCSSFYAEDDGSGRRHRGAVLQGDVVQVIIPPWWTIPWRRVPQICVSSSSWHCPPLRWLAWPFGYRRSETQHFLDHCWLVSFKVCTLTGFHSAVVQELTPADRESLNRTWDSCGAPIHSERLLRQSKDARSKLFLQQKAASTNNKQLTRQTCLSAACGLCLHPSAASKSLSVFEARQNISSEWKRSKAFSAAEGCKYKQ